MTEIYKEVPRTLAERLFSLTPWKKTKHVRDYHAEAVERIRASTNANTIRRANEKFMRSGWVPPAPMPPASRPSQAAYVSSCETTGMTTEFLSTSASSSYEAPQADRFSSGLGGDFGGSGASGSWDSSAPDSSSCSSSSSSYSDSSSSSSCDSGSSYSSD